jgi:hypothetical protein
VAVLSLLLAANAAAATLTQQCGAVGIVTYDLLPVLPAPPAGMLARQCGAVGVVTYDSLPEQAGPAGMLARQYGAVGIVTYDPIPLTEPTNTVMSVIESVADWNALSAAVADGSVTDGTIVRLACDVGPVTTMVGTSEHPFAGVFDGGSNTLRVALSGSDEFIAPFSRISGATIRNLKVAGTVSGRMHCSGLVGKVDGGANLVEGCEVAAAISSSGSHFGGFVGHSVTYAVTLRGCVFSGSLSGGTYVATFHAWSDGGAATTLIDCLDASTSAQPIGRGHDAACVSNTYYLAIKNFSNGERLWSAGKRGKRAYAITAGEGVTIDFGTPTATYGTTGITAYPVGMAYRRSGTPAASSSTFYAAGGDAVQLGLSATPPTGMALDAYMASAGTLSQSGSVWTLAMPAGDVVVSATFSELTPYEAWAAANGVEGAWDKTDALGIHNVFRYVFDKPAGEFADPPLLDVAIEGGDVVVKTPPIVNMGGFVISVVESSDLAGKTVTETKPLNSNGRTNFAFGSASSRFYRLSATPSD